MRRDAVKQALRLAPILVVLALFVSAVREERGAQQARLSFRSCIRSMKKGQFAEARREIDEAVRLAPQNANYLAHRALLGEREVAAKYPLGKLLSGEIELGESDRQLLKEAAISYRRAIDLNPLDDSYHHNLGWILFFLQEPDQAAEHIREAVRIDGSNGLYRVSLGLLQERAHLADEARAQYAQALQLSPSIVDSTFFAELRARAPEEADGILADSVESLEGMLGQKRDPIIEARLCRLYLAQGRTEKALALTRQVLSELPALPRPWYVLGRLYELQNNEAEAEQCYKKAAYLDASDSLTALRLAQLYDRRHVEQEAQRYYSQALKSWENQTSVHAGRVGRIYRSSTIADDVVPKGLLAYCNASFDVAQAQARLAQLESDLQPKAGGR